MKKIKMRTTMAGPEGTFQAEQTLTVGVQVSAELAHALVPLYATVVEVEDKQVAAETLNPTVETTEAGQNEVETAAEPQRKGFQAKQKRKG